MRAFCDTSPVLERAWAEMAGLGFIGKSNLFIHRRYGTWTFLGGMVCNQSFAADKPQRQVPYAAPVPDVSRRHAQRAR